MPPSGNGRSRSIEGGYVNQEARQLPRNRTSISSTNNTNSEWSDTEKFLRAALAANRELQADILSQLAQIAQRKCDNRLEAERCIELSCAVVLAGETIGSTTTPLSTTASTESSSKQVRDRKEDNPKDKSSNNEISVKRKKRKKAVRGDLDYVPTNEDINALLAGDGIDSIDKGVDDQTNGDVNEVDKSHNDDKAKKKWPLYLRKKFRYDPYRKWTSEYFIDPTGSRPKPNEDTIRRRKLMMKKVKKARTSNSDQQEDEDEMVPDNFYYHRSQPFTRKEKALLDKWLLEGSNNKWIGGGGDDSSLFYESIAQRLRKEHHENIAARKKDKALLPTCVPRSSEDIRLYHKHLLASQYEFSKEESLAILEGVAELTSDAKVHGNTSVGKESGESIQDNFSDYQKSKEDRGQNQAIGRTDWQEICNRVLEVHRRAHSGHNCPGDRSTKKNLEQDEPIVTPYQCMVHYKRNLRPQPDGSFTPEEDELLLRYIAAMGPQFVWGYPQIADLASRLFPHKPSRRIYERTLFSQWHPLSKDTMWTKEEEQKLVIAMKIYSDIGIDENNATAGDAVVGDDVNDKRDGGEVKSISEEQRIRDSEKAALRKAAAHFHPYRQPYKVVKKWERSFSPRFSYKPFSKEEDAKLLAAVRASAVGTPFSEIARKSFPNRSSDKLYQRWSKIAPDEEVVKKSVPSIVRSGLKRGLLSTKPDSNPALTGAVTSPEGSNHNDGAQNSNRTLFDTSDFVVEVFTDEGVNNQK